MPISSRGGMLSILLVALCCAVVIAFRSSPVQKITPGTSHATSLRPLFSAVEQFLAQKAAMERDLREERAKTEFKTELNRFMSGQGGDSKLADEQFWNQFARGGLQVSSPQKFSHQSIVDPSLAAELQQQKTLLENRGFCKVTGLDWERLGVNLKGIEETMQNLKDNGWPPVFIFMFDEVWKYLDGVYDILRPLIGDDEAVLEHSIFAWALDKPPRPDEIDRREKVGGNFGMPHRDLPFDECHDPATGQSTVLSIWCPITDAVLDNGCMMAIPREHDVHFENYQDKERHLSPFKYDFNFAATTPLPAPAGSVLVWHPNIIHWGSACSAYAAGPARKSIAGAFRLPERRLPTSEKERRLYGRGPVTREELRAGLGVDTKLRCIAYALMMYSVWFPEFEGFDAQKLRS